MKRRLLQLAAVIHFATIGSAIFANTVDKPNSLFIMVDDLFVPERP